jgi:hypothetical protein
VSLNFPSRLPMALYTSAMKNPSES